MKVFISYSSKNRLRALRLAESLQEYNIDVWWDEWEILVGHSILDSIYNGIRSCDYLAIILTEQSVKSAYVKEELNFAKQIELENQKVKILPLLYEKCQIPDTLKGKHYADFTNFERGFSDLLKCLGIFHVDPIKTKRLPEIDDNEITKLFSDIESKNHEKALKAAAILAKFRDPKAKKFLLEKLKGDAYSRQIAIVGLCNYETDDVLIPILHAVPVDFLLCEYAEEMVGDLTLETIRHFFQCFSSFKTDLAILYLWGIFLSSVNLGHSLSDNLRKVACDESIKCLQQIGGKQLANTFIRLFGYENSVKKLEIIYNDRAKLDFIGDINNLIIIKNIIDSLKTENKDIIKIPTAKKVLMSFKNSTIVHGAVITIEPEEFELLKKSFKKYYSKARKDADEEAKIIGAFAMSVNDVYGFLPDDSYMAEDVWFFSTLELFMNILESESNPVTEKEILESVSDKNSSKQQIKLVAADLYDYIRIVFPQSAINLMLIETMIKKK